MFLTFFTINKMASAVAMMIGGAVVNALAFTGGNFLFSKLGKTQDAEKERERHDRAVEQLEAAQAAWSQKRVQRLFFILDWILLMSKCKKSITQSRLLMM